MHIENVLPVPLFLFLLFSTYIIMSVYLARTGGTER